MEHVDENETIEYVASMGRCIVNMLHTLFQAHKLELADRCVSSLFFHSHHPWIEEMANDGMKSFVRSYTQYKLRVEICDYGIGEGNSYDIRIDRIKLNYHILRWFV